VRDLQPFNEWSEQIGDDFCRFQQILADGTATCNEGVRDLPKLFRIGLDSDISCAFEYLLLIFKLVFEGVKSPLVDFDYQLLEVVAEMDLSCPNDALFPVQLFDHLVNSLQTVGSYCCSQLVLYVFFDVLSPWFFRLLLLVFDCNCQAAEFVGSQNFGDFCLPLFFTAGGYSVTLNFPKFLNIERLTEIKRQHAVNDEIF